MEKDESMISESKMSSLTHERQRKRENGIKYWIDIRDFSKKTNWPCGKEIYSRRFKVSDSVFRIDIYPNGNSSEETGHVSVYLHNKSSWEVKCSVTFAVKRHSHRETFAGDIENGQGKGLPKFVSHEDVRRNLLNGDGGLTLEVDVKLLEEEVTAARYVDSQTDALLSLQSEVSTIKEELENQKTEIQNISCKLNEIFRVLNRMVANANPTGSATLESPSLTVLS